MWRIIKTVIIVFLIVVAIKAHNNTEENGKSFWYNAGQTSVDIVNDVGDLFKPVADDVQKGIKEG